MGGENGDNGDLRLSEALLQGLLEHLRRCRRERVPRVARQYPAGWLIGYGALIEASGVRTVAAWMTAPLAEIGQVARARGWPDLPALVVNQTKGYPGPGYFRQPGAPMPDVVGRSDLDAWERKALACMEPWPLPRGGGALGKGSEVVGAGSGSRRRVAV